MYYPLTINLSIPYSTIMSIRDAQRLRRVKQADRSVPVHDLETLTSTKEPRHLPNVYPSSSDRKLDETQRYLFQHVNHSKPTNKPANKPGSESLKARYEGFLNHPMIDCNGFSDSDETITSERQEPMVRSWVVSSLPTGRYSSL